jgi:hypothetical protein
VKVISVKKIIYQQAGKKQVQLMNGEKKIFLGLSPIFLSSRVPEKFAEFFFNKNKFKIYCLFLTTFFFDCPKILKNEK